MSTHIPFIGEIFSHLNAAANARILAEIRDGEVTGVTGSELLELVRKARTFIASKGLRKGDRCGLLAALEKLSCEGEAIADGIARTVVRNLKVMARMGVYFEEEVQRRYPEFETRRGEWSWEDYLPPMSAGLRELVAAYN